MSKHPAEALIVALDQTVMSDAPREDRLENVTAKLAGLRSWLEKEEPGGWPRDVVNLLVALCDAYLLAPRADALRAAVQNHTRTVLAMLRGLDQARAMGADAGEPWWVR